MSTRRIETIGGASGRRCHRDAPTTCAAGGRAPTAASVKEGTWVIVGTAPTEQMFNSPRDPRTTDYVNWVGAEVPPVSASRRTGGNRA